MRRSGVAAAIVLLASAARRRHLLASSGKNGRAVETVAVRTRGKRGTYVFLDVYLPEHGASSAEYPRDDHDDALTRTGRVGA